MLRVSKSWAMNKLVTFACTHCQCHFDSDEYVTRTITDYLPRRDKVVISTATYICETCPICNTFNMVQQQK